MKIKIKETGEIVDVILMDENGNDLAKKAITVSGEIKNGIIVNLGDGLYEADQVTVKYWLTFVKMVNDIIGAIKDIERESGNPTDFDGWETVSELVEDMNEDVYDD